MDKIYMQLVITRFILQNKGLIVLNFMYLHYLRIFVEYVIQILIYFSEMEINVI